MTMIDKTGTLTALLAVLLLAGCTPGRVVEGSQVSRIKVIGVVSAVGDTFLMSEIGPTVFQNRVSETPIPDWNIDAAATSIAARSLEAGGYKAVAIPTSSHAQIAEAHRATLTRDLDVEAMRSILRAANPPAGVDAFLILAKARGREPCSPNTTAQVQGVGICAGVRIQMSSPNPGEEPRDIVGPYGNRMLAPFASYRITLLRAADFEVLGSHTASMRRSDRTMLGVPKLGSAIPYRQIHADAYRTSFAEFTGEQRRAVREVIVELLGASIPEALKAMQLVPN